MNKNTIIGISTAVILILAGLVIYLLVSQNNNSTENQQANQSQTEQSPDITDTTSNEIDDTQLASTMAAMEEEYETVIETKVFTEANDPNNTLGKPGSYTHGAAFWDTRTEYTGEDPTWGTDAGGAIEVFATTEDAASRAETLRSTQGTILDAGAVEQVDNVVIRVSSKLSASQQNEIIAFLKSQL